MITAFAPATIGNITCGFDVLGMCIDQPYDEVSVSFNDENRVRITKILGDNGKLPYEVEKNTASVAVISLLKHLNIKKGMDIVINKQMPFGSGLGSSAASAVAGVVAANALLGLPLKKHELLPFAIDGEAIASGSRHADNVAPCLLGGITLVRENEPLDVIELAVPEDLYVVAVHQQVQILTKAAREVIPKHFSMKESVSQMGNIAAFVAALYQNDLSLMSRSLKDVLAEPYRKALIPNYEALEKAVLYAGALSFGISGSGPTVFAFANNKNKIPQIEQMIRQVLDKTDIAYSIFSSKINRTGAEIR